MLIASPAQYNRSMSSPPTLPLVTREIMIQLESMIYGGAALGHSDGKAIFVNGGLPGEVVRVAIDEERAKFARGHVVAIDTPSTERVLPRCPYFGFTERACGGCQWQHIAYEAQLRFKRDIVREQLQRLGRIVQPPVRDTIASPQVWHYRNHAQFQRAADGTIGFKAARSQRVIALDDCFIIAAPLRAWLQDRSRIAGAPQPDRLSVRCSENPERLGGALAFQLRDAELRVSADSFFQVNSALLATLIAEVLRRMDVQPTDTVLDAYCGVGLFSLFLTERAAQVWGIESSASAVADWRFNLREYPQARIWAGLVEQMLPTLSRPIHAAVVDPPRAGCGPQAIQAVVAQQIDRVVYVSCDPSTLARDVRQLIDGGYRLIDAQPIDLFPHTYHIETVALLQRADQAIL